MSKKTVATASPLADVISKDGRTMYMTLSKTTGFKRQAKVSHGVLIRVSRYTYDDSGKMVSNEVLNQYVARLDGEINKTLLEGMLDNVTLGSTIEVQRAESIDGPDAAAVLDRYFDHDQLALDDDSIRQITPDLIAFTTS